MKKRIVILGCGLSGILTALSFAKKNIKTTILEYQSVNVDKSNLEFCTDTRAIAITPATVRFLKDINSWALIEELASKMLEVYVVDNKAPEMVWLKDNKNNKPLGYIINHGSLKKILINEVKKHPLIEIIDQLDYQKVESKSDCTIIHYKDNKVIESDLLIVCDGFNSKVRSYYFSNKVEKSYNQTALTFNIKHNKDHENCATEHFMPTGPFAILPLKDNFCSSIVWTVEAEQTSLLLSLPKEEIEYLVNRNCGDSLGIISIDSEISAFPLKARITNKYFYNKIVLVADSAHIIHPLAGQGLNQGIKDIETLTQLISDNEINRETLTQYQKLRKDDNFIMYMITDYLNNIFSDRLKTLCYFRRLGLATIDNIPFVKDLIGKYAIGHR